MVGTLQSEGKRESRESRERREVAEVPGDVNSSSGKERKIFQISRNEAAKGTKQETKSC